MDHAEHCDALEVEVEQFATALSHVSGDTVVATCPGWTIDDLTLHLGTIHRWAEELVRTRSSVRIPRATLTLDEVTVTPEWLREGGQQLVTTLREVDPQAEMWAWGLDQHARFWSRRQVHETLVHRMDAELAGGMQPTADSLLAGDAIDEFLSNIQKVTDMSAETSLCGNGERLVFRANDTDAAWSITLRDGGFDVVSAFGEFDTLVEGSAVDLLLMTVGRRSIGDGTFNVTGDRKVADFWLANSSFG